MAILITYSAIIQYKFREFETDSKFLSHSFNFFGCQALRWNTCDLLCGCVMLDSTPGEIDRDIGVTLNTNAATAGQLEVLL